MTSQAYIEVQCSKTGFVLVTACASKGPAFFAARLAPRARLGHNGRYVSLTDACSAVLEVAASGRTSDPTLWTTGGTWRVDEGPTLTLTALPPYAPDPVWPVHPPPSGPWMMSKAGAALAARGAAAADATTAQARGGGIR